MRPGVFVTQGGGNLDGKPSYTYPRAPGQPVLREPGLLAGLSHNGVDRN